MSSPWVRQEIDHYRLNKERVGQALCELFQGYSVDSFEITVRRGIPTKQGIKGAK